MDDLQYSLLDKFYLRYLDDEDSAAFITAISQNYLVSTLERITEIGGRASRRGAVLALGFLGTYQSNAILGHALSDPDRVVRSFDDAQVLQAVTAIVERISSRKRG